MRKSIILLGKGTPAIRIADWFRQNDEYKLDCVVPSMPEPTWTESLTAWCHSNDVSCIETGRYEDIPGVESDSWRAPLALSVFYNRIIRNWFIEKTERILNLHNAPLPRYRGCAPINWALKNGESSHGVTIHEITPKVDAGPIVSQVNFSIHPETDEVIDAYRRALDFGFKLFEQTMPILDRIKPRPQDESQALYYSRADQARLGDRRSFTRAEPIRGTTRPPGPGTQSP